MPLELIDAITRFDRALSTVDVQDAVGIVEELLADGVDPLVVLTDVIAAAQREVGGRWQRGEWSVAEEHAATAVAVSATEAVTRYVRGTPVTGGTVVVVCAEREWHALPAALIGCALRAHGWNITLLGAATPPQRLSKYLHDLGPDATALSCSILGALPTSRRIIEASTAAGVPVVAGGSAFGSDAVRADALGATAWAPNARAAVQVVAGLPRVVPAASPLPAEPAAEQAALELAQHRLAEQLRQRWSLATRVASSAREPLDAVAEVLDDVINQALHAVSAALITGDTRPLPETARWVAELLGARGADVALVTELGELLGGGLRDYPLARALVAEHWAVSETAFR